MIKWRVVSLQLPAKYLQLPVLLIRQMETLIRCISRESCTILTIGEEGTQQQDRQKEDLVLKVASQTGKPQLVFFVCGLYL